MNLFLFEIAQNHRSIGENVLFTRIAWSYLEHFKIYYHYLRLESKIPDSLLLEEQDFRHQVSNNQVFELYARLLSPLFLGFVFLSPLVHLPQA